jgi:hypothetical protein
LSETPMWSPQRFRTDPIRMEAVGMVSSSDIVRG